MATEECDVLICGAGVGGMVLALALGRRGITVELIEQSPSPPMPRRAENLQPNGLRVLDQLGLLSPLRSAGAHVNERFHFISIDPAGGGRTLCTVDYRELPGPYPYTLITTPAVMQPLLLTALSAEPAVRCRWGAVVTGLGVDRDGVTVQTRTADGATPRLRSRLLVGADGVHSTVRRVAGIEASVHLYRDGYATLLAPRPAELGGDSRYAVGGGEIMALFPVSKSDVAILYMVPRTAWASVQSGGLDAFKSRLLSIAPMMTASLHGVTSWDQVGFMPCARVRAKRWTADRIALIGDAAHAMNPHVAQGRNQALVDALVLAELIEEGLRRDDLSGSHLARYEAARRPQVERLQRAADEMVWFWNSGWGPVSWLRERVFLTLSENRRLRGRMMALVGGLPVEPYSLVERFQAAGFFPDRRAAEMVTLPETW